MFWFELRARVWIHLYMVVTGRTMSPIIRSQEEATKQVILIGEKGTKGGCQSAATLKTSLNY